MYLRNNYLKTYLDILRDPLDNPTNLAMIQYITILVFVSDLAYMWVTK